MARDYEKYSKDALIAHIYELEKQLKNNKYGLYWDKSIEKETVVTQCKTNIPILTREAELCILDDVDADTHILIEGDNFHALTAMNMMYGNEGFVDIEYIDPPYNTQRKDFVYDDDYVDTDDGFRHSKWLAFMDARLNIARKILKDTGVIFISIDDNEFSQLKLLCDSIFGEKNMVATFCVIRAEGGGMAKQVIKGHDYCLVYAKNINNFTPLGKPKDIRGKIVEKNGIKYWIQEDWLRKKFGKYGNCHYEELIEYKGEEYKREIDKGLENGDYVLISKDNGMHVIGKLRRVDKDSSKFYSILKHLNKNGVNELKDMGIHFDYPKPVSLIKELVYGASLFDKNVTILDFFAGSGTTAQAVLELNKEDGGRRRCIICTNNEANICTDVTYPRIKTVISGRRPDGTEYSEGIPANLMYYKTDFIKDSKDTDQAKYCLVEKVDELLCIVEETYIAKERTAQFSHYESLSGERHTFIYSDYYSEEPFKKFCELILNVDGEKTVYMFSTDNIIDERLFEGLNGVTVKPIPNKIYEIYREIVEDIKRGEQ